MYQEKVNMEQGIRLIGEKFTDRSFLKKSHASVTMVILSWLLFLFRKGSLVFLAKEQIPVQAADHNNAAEDIADGGGDQIVEDKGSDI